MHHRSEYACLRNGSKAMKYKSALIMFINSVHSLFALLDLPSTFFPGSVAQEADI